MSRVLGFYVADPGLIPRIPGGFLRTEPGVSPEHRWVWPRNKLTKKKVIRNNIDKSPVP